MQLRYYKNVVTISLFLLNVNPTKKRGRVRKIKYHTT